MQPKRFALYGIERDDYPYLAERQDYAHQRRPQACQEEGSASDHNESVKVVVEDAHGPETDQRDPEGEPEKQETDSRPTVREG